MGRMSRTLPALVAPVLLMSAVPAMAQQSGATDPGIYIRGGLGYSISGEDEIDYSPLWSLGVGYRFTPNIRVDVMADWRDRYIVEGGRGVVPGAADLDSQVENQAYMFNAYYDFATMNLGPVAGVRPYVGVGAGLSTTKVDDATVFVDIDNDNLEGEFRDFFGDEDDQFAWQLMAGVAFDFSTNMFADIGYRYADLGEVGLSSTQGGIDSDLNVHEIMVSVGYKF
ncbi:outer membrane protein [Indioceanicola profundi]|uniref:outer membrane protein n=1 Tax=Indioceanicola profundi TaxID=2220096 RepID=UPI0013C49346|nr:outer membrane protein [Indioceanicola profundi]